jgi:hypothetical protein
LLTILLPAATAQPGWCVPQVAINEVLADPARDWDGDLLLDSTDDEWVEIVNVGAVPADLTGLRLGDLERAWAYEFAGTLPIGERLVIFGSVSQAWQQANGEPAFGHRLANTGDTVVLWHIAGADTSLVDQFTFLDHEAEDDRSSGRRPDGGPTWELFDALNPYTGDEPPLGNGCGPSPGGSNSCVTPVEETTWGRIKARMQEGARN